MKLRAFHLILLLPALVVGGCTTKSKARAQAAQAYTAGQEQARKQSQNEPRVITITGQVRNHVVPWQEGLTLAQAIDAAVYTGFTDPRTVLLTRGSETVEIKVKDLLRGTSNPEVEPGDLIEIRR
jgi:hypothetical protein